jgi:hypothetical protein
MGEKKNVRKRNAAWNNLYEKKMEGFSAVSI